MLFKEGSGYYWVKWAGGYGWTIGEVCGDKISLVGREETFYICDFCETVLISTRKEPVKKC